MYNVYMWCINVFIPAPEEDGKAWMEWFRFLLQHAVYVSDVCQQFLGSASRNSGCALVNAFFLERETQLLLGILLLSAFEGTIFFRNFMYKAPWCGSDKWIACWDFIFKICVYVDLDMQWGDKLPQLWIMQTLWCVCTHVYSWMNCFVLLSFAWVS